MTLKIKKPSDSISTVLHENGLKEFSISSKGLTKFAQTKRGIDRKERELSTKRI